MSDDKLPDVVWLHPDEDDWWPDGPDEHLTGSTPYVPKFALDAMTAERDAYRERYGSSLDDAIRKSTMYNEAIEERDSARETLSRACAIIQQMCDVSDFMPDDVAEFLDAQPKTKP